MAWALFCGDLGAGLHGSRCRSRCGANLALITIEVWAGSIHVAASVRARADKSLDVLFLQGLENEKDAVACVPAAAICNDPAQTLSQCSLFANSGYMGLRYRVLGPVSCFLINHTLGPR